eukprot:3610808-Prymnesium_polylepis.1
MRDLQMQCRPTCGTAVQRCATRESMVRAYRGSQRARGFRNAAKRSGAAPAGHVGSKPCQTPSDSGKADCTRLTAECRARPVASECHEASYRTMLIDFSA